MQNVAAIPQTASSAITRQLGLSIGKPVCISNPRTALVIPCRTRLTRQPSLTASPHQVWLPTIHCQIHGQIRGHSPASNKPAACHKWNSCCSTFSRRFIEALSRPLVTQAVRDSLSELRQSEAFRQHGGCPRTDRGADCQALPTAAAPASDPGGSTSPAPWCIPIWGARR